MDSKARSGKAGCAGYSFLGRQINFLRTRSATTLEAGRRRLDKNAVRVHEFGRGIQSYSHKSGISTWKYCATGLDWNLFWSRHVISGSGSNTFEISRYSDLRNDHQCGQGSLSPRWQRSCEHSQAFLLVTAPRLPRAQTRAGRWFQMFFVTFR